MTLDYLVVGGGMAGLVAATMLADDGATVKIWESQSDLGGLLRSDDSFGWSFDRGTHIPRQTGVAELDALLFAGADDWEELRPLRAGNVFAHEVNQRSPFPDLRRMSSGLLAQMEHELVDAAQHQRDDVPADLQEFARETFGKAISEAVITPLMDRHFERPLDQLAPEALDLFFRRVIAFTPEETRVHKERGLDASLGFHSYDEGMSDLVSLYPHEGGAGAWVAAVTRRAREAGVEIECQRHALRVVPHPTGFSVFDRLGSEARTRRLIWTPTAFTFLRAVGVRLAPESPPKLLSTHLLDLILDRPCPLDVHFLTSLDPDLTTFRLTNYRTLAPLSSSAERAISIEVLGSASSPPPSADQVLNELESVGAISPGTFATAIRRRLVRDGFPVPDTTLAATVERHRSMASDFDGVTLVGRGAGRAFFLEHVLRDTFETVSSL